MQKSFLSNLILIVVLNLLVKPFYLLGIDAEIQNRVGAEVYGNYFALLNFSFLLNILLDFGITNFNNRNLAQNPQLASKHFGQLLSLRIILFAVYALVTVGLGFTVGYNSNELYFLGVLVFNQFLVATIQYARSNFAGLHFFKIDAFISILDRFLLIIFCGVLLWSPMVKVDFKIEWFIYGQSLAYGISVMICLILLKIKVGKFKLKLKRAFSLALIKQSLPFALLILLMMFYNRVDSIMLERLLIDGDKQAGIYAQGFRYLDAVNMFALLFAGLLLPMFAKQIKLKQSINPLLKMGVSILIPISLIVGITAYFNQELLMSLRYSDNISEASVSFGYLILSFIPVCLTYIFGTLLTANGSLKQLNIMAIGGLILNVSLNLWLIPELKSEGAALATLVTQIATALVQVILVISIFKLKPNWRLIIKIAFLMLAVFGLNLWLEFSLLGDVTNMLCVICCSFMVALSIGILPIKSIILLLKDKK